jgi:hypothetical protein
MIFQKKYTPFSKLSHHKQKDLFVKLRGEIKKTASEYGGNFTSPLVLNEPDRPDFFNQWFDFYFLGLDGVTIWNTVIYTANNAYWDAISDLAYKEADRLCPNQKNNLDDFLIPVYDKITGKKLHYIMKDPEIEPELNNLTRSDFVEEYSSKLIHEDKGETAPIFESFKINKTYHYGIGLYAIVDAPYINKETIEAMIDKFRAMGEQEWKSPIPVDRAKLPANTFMVLAKKLNYNKKDEYLSI